MEFYKMLKKLREEKGMTMEELSKKLNISISALSNYENNRRMPNIELLTIFANFFGVSLEYITSGTNKSTEHVNSKEVSEILKNNKTIKISGTQEDIEKTIIAIVDKRMKEQNEMYMVREDEPQTLKQAYDDLRNKLIESELLKVRNIKELSLEQQKKIIQFYVKKITVQADGYEIVTSLNIVTVESSGNPIEYVLSTFINKPS